jgi:hypothetical protein
MCILFFNKELFNNSIQHVTGIFAYILNHNKKIIYTPERTGTFSDHCIFTVKIFALIFAIVPILVTITVPTILDNLVNNGHRFSFLTCWKYDR